MRRFLFGLAILAIAAPLAHANDDQIAHQIIKSLKAKQAQGDLKNFNIGLRVRDGDVFLNGHVADAQQERLALEAARAADGVGQVFNEIHIREVQTKLAKHTVAKEPQTLKAPAPMPTVHVANLEEIAAEPEVELALLEGEENESRTSTPSLANAKAIATEIIRRFREEKASGNLRGFGIDGRHSLSVTVRGVLTAACATLPHSRE